MSLELLAERRRFGQAPESVLREAAVKAQGLKKAILDSMGAGHGTKKVRTSKVSPHSRKTKKP